MRNTLIDCHIVKNVEFNLQQRSSLSVIMEEHKNMIFCLLITTEECRCIHHAFTHKITCDLCAQLVSCSRLLSTTSVSSN